MQNLYHMQNNTYMEKCLPDFPLIPSREIQNKILIPCVCNTVSSGLPLQVADILHAAVTALGQLKLDIPGRQLLRLTGRAGNHMTQSVDCSRTIPYKQMTLGHCQRSHQLQKLKDKNLRFKNCSQDSQL